jgi:methyl-accepting chemotaxis protein
MRIPLPSRLSHQLALAFGVVLALLLALLVTALATQHRMATHMQQTLDGDTVKGERVVDVAQHAYDSALAMRNLSVINNPSELGEEYTRLARHLKAHDDTLASFSKLLDQVGSTQEEQDQLQKVLEAAKAAREIMALASSAAQGGAPDDLAIGIRTELRRDLPRWNGALAAWIGAINTLRQLEVTNTRQRVAAINEVVISARIALVVMASIALLIGVLAAWSVTRAISLPMSRAVLSANRMAQGNLAESIENQGNGEVAQLLQALHDMQSHLVGVVAKVRQGSEGVADASAEIAQGNQDLSNRTEQQASALEETTAAMEDLTVRVRNNAESAQHANQLAIRASEVAAAGGTAVSRVVKTMQGINTSSQKISDITSVIDGIAFQTNILALNAAVEAARAGDLGRGFAVVATEVRSLASRSAEAAKEIKVLIAASVQQVEEGTTLVDQTKDTMAEVVNSIQQVTAIMQEISSASKDQALGVSQISEAIHQMDQVTQQNAALVEEIAAAAANLKNLADEQVQAVSVFRLGATVGAKPILARR